MHSSYLYEIRVLSLFSLPCKSPPLKPRTPSYIDYIVKHATVLFNVLHQMYRRRLQESKHKKVQNWEKKTHRSPFLINLLAEVQKLPGTILNLERWVYLQA